MSVQCEDQLRPILAALCENPDPDLVQNRAQNLVRIGVIAKCGEHNAHRRVGKNRSLISITELEKVLDKLLSN